MKENKRGIVYVMWNELFPELVKIGITQGDCARDVERRRRELSCGENMPQPFEAKYAICVNNYQAVEQKLHKGLNKLRHNPHREFFRLSVDEAITLLSGLVVSGGATEVDIQNNFEPEEQKVREKTRAVRDKVSFNFLGLPVGTKLYFVSDHDLTVSIANGSRLVTMPDGTQTTLSQAARRYRNQINPDNNIKGLPDGAMDFVYQNKTLWELFLEKQRLMSE